MKTTSSKSRKIDIFPKGLTHGFGPKMAIFPTFSFPQCRPGKCILRYSRTKNASLGYKKKVEEVRKLTFFQRGLPMLLVQKWPFFQLFFLGNFSQENVFNAILERANAFLGFKKTEVQKVEKLTFFQRG